MSARILRQHGINCNTTYPAKLNGYALSIRPRVNLTPSVTSTSYGGLALLSHLDIETLYSNLKRDFDIDYFPHPVIVELPDNSTRSALCYLCSEISDEAPNPEYINEMQICAKELDAPESYISHIKSFNES